MKNRMESVWQVVVVDTNRIVAVHQSILDVVPADVDAVVVVDSVVVRVGV